jgi:hypothetical protein
MQTIPDAQSIDYLTEKRKILPLIMNRFGPQIDRTATRLEEEYLVTGTLKDADLTSRFQTEMQAVIDNS